MGDEVEFLPGDKHKCFLQDGSITLEVISQTGPKYQKHEGWSWFFACWQMLKVFSNWYCHFRCVWPGMCELPKIASLLFLYNMSRKKWVMQLIFYMQISKEVCYKIFRWVWSSIPEVPKKASLQCLYNIPKNVRNEVDFFDADKHQSFLTVDFNTLGIKVFYNVTGMIMKMWRTWWWKWSSISKYS